MCDHWHYLMEINCRETIKTDYDEKVCIGSYDCVVAGLHRWL